MAEQIPFMNLAPVLMQGPQAMARIRGSQANPGLFGGVYFYQMRRGVLVIAEVNGLPRPTTPCGARVFAFHIHNGSRCSGTESDPFADAQTHYNPNGCPHPYHAGDLPPLFGNQGYALQAFLTDRFSVREILQKTVIIHAQPDDFTSQPGGNAGEKIACGQILPVRRR